MLSPTTDGALPPCSPPLRPLSRWPPLRRRSALRSPLSAPRWSALHADPPLQARFHFVAWRNSAQLRCAERSSTIPTPLRFCASPLCGLAQLRSTAKRHALLHILSRYCMNMSNFAPQRNDLRCSTYQIPLDICVAAHCRAAQLRSTRRATRFSTL